METQKSSNLLENIEFLEFVLRGAEDMLVHATAEDLAIFGFGDMESAIEAFEEHKARSTHNENG